MFRSAKHIYAQVIDDDQQKTLVATSDQKLEKARPTTRARRSAPRRSAPPSPRSCKEKGIDKVVFDRNGYIYHGRVTALADGAREAGLKF